MTSPADDRVLSTREPHHTTGVLRFMVTLPAMQDGRGGHLDFNDAARTLHAAVLDNFAAPGHEISVVPVCDPVGR